MQHDDEMGFELDPDTQVTVTMRAGDWNRIGQVIHELADPHALVFVNTLADRDKVALEDAAFHIRRACQTHPAAQPRPDVL